MPNILSILARRAYFYFRYLQKATNAHGLHSPFMFDWYNEVVVDKKQYYDFDYLARLRAQLRKNRQTINVEDLGAGSAYRTASKIRKTTVRHIAMTSLGSQAKHEMLFRMVAYARPQVVVELGTSLGLSTLYLEKATTKANIYTFEGSKDLCSLAEALFATEAERISVVCGNIDHTLPEKLKEIAPVDFFFIDANHRYEASLRYFEWCLGAASPEAVIVMDDIYWSAEMEAAWRAVIRHPEVGLSVDCFHLGILFLRKKQPKQHFVLKF